MDVTTSKDSNNFCNNCLQENCVITTNTNHEATELLCDWNGNRTPLSNNDNDDDEEENIENSSHKNQTNLSSNQGRKRRRNSASFSMRRSLLIFFNTMTMNTNSHYFRHYTKSKGILYGAAILYVFSCSFVSIFEPFLVYCREESTLSNFENPGYAFAQGQFHRVNNCFFAS